DPEVLRAGAQEEHRGAGPHDYAHRARQLRDLGCVSQCELRDVVAARRRVRRLHAERRGQVGAADELARDDVQGTGVADPVVRVGELERLVRDEPDNLGLRVQLAGALREAGRTREAIELYRSVALWYRDQGRAQQAQAVCESILAIAPDDT